MKIETIEQLELFENELMSKSLSEVFHERSEIAQEIISRKSDFIERWALLIFCVLLLTIITAAWFIKYPDIIEGRAMLAGNNAPKEIVAIQSGRITGLFVSNNEKVVKGQVIAWVESIANPSDVLELSMNIKKSIDLLSKNRKVSLIKLLDKSYSNLGEIQNQYQVFILAWQEYRDYTLSGFNSKRIRLFDEDILSLINVKNKTTQLRTLAEKDNELAKRTFEMQENLFKSKTISLEEYRQAQSALVNKNMTVPQMEINIFSHDNRIREKQKEISLLKQDMLQQKQRFEQALQRLNTEINNWKKQYIIQSPIDGTVDFTSPIQLNQYVNSGKLFGYVNPDSTTYYVELLLSQSNFGKVDTGMKTHLRFDAYPYNEVGFVSGTISHISGVALDSGFLAKVRLDDGLITDQRVVLQYKSGLRAQAIVIAKNRRLFQRFYNEITKLVSINN